MGQGAKPVCRFCQLPVGLRQYNIKKLLVWLHNRCVGKYTQSWMDE